MTKLSSKLKQDVLHQDQLQTTKTKTEVKNNSARPEPRLDFKTKTKLFKTKTAIDTTLKTKTIYRDHIRAMNVLNT